MESLQRNSTQSKFVNNGNKKFFKETLWMNCTVGYRIPSNWCNLWSHFKETLHSPNSSTTEIKLMKMILISGKSISTLFTVFCRNSLLFFLRKNLLRDMTDLTTMQTVFFLNAQSIRAHHDQLSFLIESFDNKPALIGLTD